MLFESYWESEYPRLGESCYICTKNNDNSNTNNDDNYNDNNDNTNNNAKDNNNNNNTKGNKIDILYGFNTWFNNSKPSEGWKIKPKKDKFTSILLSNIIQSYNEKDCDNNMTNFDESDTIISRYFGANRNLSDEEDESKNEINDRKILIENLKKKYDNDNNNDSGDDDDDDDNGNESNKVGEVIRRNVTVCMNEDNDKGVEEGVKVKEGEGGGDKGGEEEVVKNVNETNDNTQGQDPSDEDKAEVRNIEEKIETEEEIESSNDHTLETSNDNVKKSCRIDKCSGMNADISIKMSDKGDVLNDGSGGELGRGMVFVEVRGERDGREVKGGAEDKGWDDIGDKAGEEEGEVEEKGRGRGRSVIKENQIQVVDIEIEKEKNVKGMEIKNKTEELDEDDIIISESASNNSHSENENGNKSESENEISSQLSQKHKKLKNTENEKYVNNSKSTEIVEEKTVILDDENSNLVYSRIHGYRILVPDKNDSKAFYKKILGGLKEVRIVMTYLAFLNEFILLLYYLLFFFPFYFLISHFCAHVCVLMILPL